MIRLIFLVTGLFTVSSVIATTVQIPGGSSTTIVPQRPVVVPQRPVIVQQRPAIVPQRRILGQQPSSTYQLPTRPRVLTAQPQEAKPMPNQYNQLTPQEAYVIRQKGTEAPGIGEYTNNKAQGVYTCRQCLSLIHI